MNIQIGTIKRLAFVLVDADGAEVAGLGTTFTVQISKNGGAFAASSGTKAEISSGWYTYELPAAETDTLGPLAIKVTHASIDQQNLVHNVVGYAPATPSGANILSVSEAATCIKGEEDDADMLFLLPLVDAFIKNHTGRDWTLDTTIHPMAKATARLLLVQWHEDPGMGASQTAVITAGLRHNLFELKYLAKSEEISGVPDELLALEQTNIGDEMAVDASILLVFNHQMAAAATSDVRLEDPNGTTVASTNTLDVTSKIMIINPSANLDTGKTYTVVIDHAEDIYGQALDDEVTFSTED